VFHYNEFILKIMRLIQNFWRLQYIWHKAAFDFADVPFNRYTIKLYVQALQTVDTSQVFHK